MLFHLSIEADRPQRVAEAIAELWGGEALPFPPVARGSWMAFAPGDNGIMVEVYPRGTVMMEAPGAADAIGVSQPQRRHSATHFAMATALPVERVHEIAAERGWTAKYCKRGGKFGVIEVWIEGGTLVEVLTPEMQAEYLAFVTPANWRAMLAAGEERMAA